MLEHSMSCEYPEGCSCGASKYNDQVKNLQHRIQELESWKESAMSILGEWEEVWEAAGKPGSLGSSKAASVREYILESV